MSAVALPQPLSVEDRQALAAFKRRRDLEASETWARLGPAATALTEALEHRPAPSAPVDRAYFRVVAWNIERGRALEPILEALTTHPRLVGADLLLLCEVDVGMARSGNRHIAAEIADALDAGYVFGNSYVCLDAGNLQDAMALGENVAENTWSLHGNAIVTPWPILSAQNLSIYVTKDKYRSSERRLGAKKALMATVDTPLGPLPCAVAHLDAFATQAQRGLMMGDILGALPSEGPALVGGDLNTTTFDMKTPVRLAFDAIGKLLRGGLGHVFHHYLKPDERYERPVFDRIAAAGFEFEAANDRHIETFHYAPGVPAHRVELEAKLPRWLVRRIVHAFARHGGAARGRLDWMLTRGLRVAKSGEAEDARGPSQGPTALPQLTDGPRPASDHGPIVCDLIASDPLRG